MDLNILLSAILGGLFVLCGSILGAYLSSRKEKKNTEDNLKLAVLRDLMGNRMALTPGIPDQNTYREVFMRTLNQVPVVFHKNTIVLDKFNKFHYHISLNHRTSSTSDDLLYELFRAIFEDLKMEVPSREVFFKSLF